MAEIKQTVICVLKAMRQRCGVSQKELAAKAGVLRQALYDIESGRYLPNTTVALELAKALDCTVEDLFLSVPSSSLSEPASTIPPGALALGRKMRPSLLGPRPEGESGILIMGCDPALDILCSQLTRVLRMARARSLFASSGQALSALARNSTQMAAIHFHDHAGKSSNAAAVQTRLAGTEYRLVGFSVMEEGLMIMRGNPLQIRSVADLARPCVRLVNREPGAALRSLLESKIAEAGLAAADLPGYDSCVYSHVEGAQHILHGLADAALGLRVTAAAFGLDFIPLASARCDLVFPQELVSENSVAAALFDVLASSRLRREIAAIPGYESSITGDLLTLNNG